MCEREKQGPSGICSQLITTLTGDSVLDAVIEAVTELLGVLE